MVSRLLNLHVQVCRSIDPLFDNSKGQTSFKAQTAPPNTLFDEVESLP
jgi:hypothetical protein